MLLPMTPPRRLRSAATLPAAVLLAAAALLLLLAGTARAADGYDAARFSNPTTIDNPWQSLQPGMQFTYRGRTIEGTEAVGHRLVSTVTDLTKTIDGVRTVVVWDRDFSAGELVEAEIAFFAQDDAGNVWELGEHPEAYEDGKIVESPTWIQGIDRAQAGISMKAAPRAGNSELFARARTGRGLHRSRPRAQGRRQDVHPLALLLRRPARRRVQPRPAGQAPAEVLRPRRRQRARRLVGCERGQQGDPRARRARASGRARHGEGSQRGAEAGGKRVPDEQEHLRAHCARRTGDRADGQPRLGHARLPLQSPRRAARSASQRRRVAS